MLEDADPTMGTEVRFGIGEVDRLSAAMRPASTIAVMDVTWEAVN